MLAAKHCSVLFSSGQNRLSIFCCVTECLNGKYIRAGLAGLDVFFNADFIFGFSGEYGKDELELASLVPSDSVLMLSSPVSPPVCLSFDVVVVGLSDYKNTLIMSFCNWREVE